MDPKNRMWARLSGMKSPFFSAQHDIQHSYNALLGTILVFWSPSSPSIPKPSHISPTWDSFPRQNPMTILLLRHHARHHHFLNGHPGRVDVSSPPLSPCHHSISLFSLNGVPESKTNRTLSCRHPYLFTSCTAFHTVHDMHQTARNSHSVFRYGVATPDQISTRIANRGGYV